MTIAFPTEETRATVPSTDPDQPIRPIANSKSQISNSPSTGPRTPEGKSRSSQNARKHNLSATHPPVSLLANPTYQISSKEFTEEFNPLQNTATPLTRLWDYHRRLQARFQSLLRQINQLKRQEQNTQDTHHRAQERQRRKDHDILSECVEEMHQRNKAKQEADRRHRQEEYDRQWITPSPGTPYFSVRTRFPTNSGPGGSIRKCWAVFR